MNRNQLDLLSWVAPAKVIPFPLSANIGKVRRTAEVLERKSGRAADGYWRRIVQPMADRLARSGVDHETIQQEVNRFSAAVQQELQRRAMFNQSGGGAA